MQNQILNKFNRFTILFLIILLFISIFTFSLASSDTVSAANVPVTTSIQDAINNANANDEIQLESGKTYTGNNNKSLSITKSLKIRGLGSGSTIDAQSSGRIIDSVSSGVTLTIINVNFINGRPSNGNNGGAIYNNNGAIINLINCTFRNNQITSTGTGQAYGGAIYNNGGSIYIENCNFQENRANRNTFAGAQGGAIYTTGSSSSLTIENSTFNSNSAYGGTTGSVNTNGGAIYIDGGTVIIDSSNFTGNSGRLGGAIYNAATLTMSNSTFEANRAYTADGVTGPGRGGAIYSENNMQVTGSVFYNNNAQNRGGAIYVDGGANKIAYSIIYGNYVGGSITADGLDFYRSGGDLDVSSNFWGDNSFSSDRLGGTNIRVDNYYIVNIKSNAATGDLLIGDQLLYYLVIYLNGTTDTSGSQYLPDLLVRLNYSSTNRVYGPRDLGNYDVYGHSNDATIYGQYSKIDVYFIGTGVLLDRLTYTSSETYKPFIDDLEVSYPNGPYYGNTTKINGTIKNIYGELITEGNVSVNINGTIYILDASQFIGGVFTLIINNNFMGEANATVFYTNATNNRSNDTAIALIHIVFPKEIEIIVDYRNGTYGGTGIINGTTYEEFLDGDEIWLDIYINGNYVGTVKIVNNKFELLLSNINFTGDVSYNILINTTLSAMGYTLTGDTNGTFNVIPKNITSDINYSNGTYGNNGWLNGTITGIKEGDSLYLLIRINGTTYNVKINPDGTFSLRLNNIGFKNNQTFVISLNNSSDGYYNMIGEVSGVFNVNPVNITIIINNKTGTYGKNGIINGIVNGFITSDEMKLKITINGIDYYVDVDPANGNFLLDLGQIKYTSDMPFTIMVNNTNGLYNYSEQTFVFIVNNANLTLDIDIKNGTYAGYGILNGTVNGIIDDNEVYLLIKINNKTYNVKVNSDGKFTLTLNNIDFKNNQTFTIRLNTTYPYNLENISDTFIVCPANLTIIIDSNNGTYGKVGWINGTVSGIKEGDTVYIIIHLDQDYYVLVDSITGKFSLKFDPVKFISDKNHTISLDNYGSDGLYSLEEINSTFKVSKANLTLNVDNHNGTYGNNGIINGTVNGFLDGDDVYLDIYLNGIYYTTVKIDSNGKFHVDVTNISYKSDISFEIILNNSSYTGYALSSTGYYALDTYNGTFIINSALLNISVDNSNGKYGEKGFINGTVNGITENDTLRLKLTINGVNYYTNVNSDGTFRFELDNINFNTKNYQITIDSTSGLYNLSSNNNTFTVIPRDSLNIILNDSYIVNQGKTNVIKGTVNGLISGDEVYVSLIIAGKVVQTVRTVNGVFTFNIFVDFNGTKTFVVKTISDDKYSEVSNSSTFKANANPQPTPNPKPNPVPNQDPIKPNNTDNIISVGAKTTGIPMNTIAILLLTLFVFANIRRNKKQ